MLKLGILDVEGRKHTLKIGEEYFVGRKSAEFSHDIEIDDQSVDIKHSIIDLTQSTSPQLFDVCTKHGTYVDEEKITRFIGFPLPKCSKIRFGRVEAYLQLVFEGDSGFLEERLNSPNDDTSEFICSSPEHITSSGSRLKNSLKSSLTTSRNETNASGSGCNNEPSKPPEDNFLIPSYLPRTSKGSNTSARSADSFCIPETQQVPEFSSGRLNNNSTDNISFFSDNNSKKNRTLDDDDDEDFFIPETQEVGVNSAAIPLSNHARVAFPSDDVNETLSQENRMPSSQFRICTQDFNGSDDELSNHSGDILANVPLSMVISRIQFEPVQVNDFVKNLEEDENENEMSALQWSKKTVEENADGSVTPDDLLDVVGSVTSDLLQVSRSKSADKALSQASTPDIFANPEFELLAPKGNDELIKEKESVSKEEDIKKSETIRPGNDENKLIPPVEEEKGTKEMNLENNDGSQSEIDYPPTQSFFKPIPINNNNNNNNKSISKPFLPPAPPFPDDDCDSLPETQVFAPPTIKPKPLVSAAPKKPEVSCSPIDGDKPLDTLTTKSIGPGQDHVFALPQASPKSKHQPPQKSTSSAVSVISATEDDLPPTQAFLKDEHVPMPTITNVFSSTLVDCGMQLSETSFKAKFNKLLDSDDDEMDEVIAPDLVKKMRESLNKPLEPIETPLTPKLETPTKQEEETSSDKQRTLIVTPDNTNFRVPGKTSTKTNYSKTPAVSIDNFMLTPDFLGKELSKDAQLQKEAEVNWRNMVLEKRNRALFGSDSDPIDNLVNSASDDSSDDSFIDLLPGRKRETRSKSVSKTSNEKVEKSKAKEEVVVCGRITRRKSQLTANIVSSEEVDKKEPRKRGPKKNDKKTSDTKDKDQKSNHAKQEKESKPEKESKSDRVSRQERTTRKEKEVEAKKDKQVKGNAEDDKKSKVTKDSKTSRDSRHVVNSRESSHTKDANSAKSSSNKKSDPVRDSSGVKEDRHSKKSSSSKESSSSTRESSSSTKESSSTKKSSSSKESSSTKESNLRKESSSRKETSSTKTSSAIKDPDNEIQEQTASRDSRLTNTSSSSSKHHNNSKESKDKNESSKEPVGGRTRARKKVEESKGSTTKVEVEKGSSRSTRTNKRNADAEKTSSGKASKINKLDGLDVTSKQGGAERSSSRTTRLKNNSDLKDDHKQETANKDREKTKGKDETKEESRKSTPTTRTSRLAEDLIDLTDSDKEERQSTNKKPSRKRKSQEKDDDPVQEKTRKPSISASESSIENSDSNRTLRRKKKIKIAMTSCSPGTRETLIRYSGRVWDYTEDPKECDVLLLEAGNRTYKLLVAIARGVPVVKIDWLKEVILMRSTEVSFDRYIFEEENFQKRHKFVMRDSLRLAKTNSLFSGINFMMTPNITPKPEEMKDIIACAGGTVLSNIPSSQEPDKKFYLVSENIDNQLWYRYRRASKDVKVVTAISVMASVMQQSLEPLIKSIH